MFDITNQKAKKPKSQKAKKPKNQQTKKPKNQKTKKPKNQKTNPQPYLRYLNPQKYWVCK
ncbi:hypothetical protein EX87_08100 [Brevibacillus laterosporus]|uniref:Uncharacterized protein n=1 Tax=Brevibacillus laterosporus TaxID=1465 RepID=A0A0F7BZA7_BRELA|nr:hypothetical protein EX87_08100 [Brevibacillus laterosporus]